MKAFFIGLQFLTRISIVKQTSWTAADFGRSVRFFPLVGVVLGSIYAGAAYLLLVVLPQQGILFPEHIRNVLLLLLPIIMTGGLHCDGFMDTMDGIFSGRSREKMLLIMKDSCVGSNAVVAFIAYILFEYALLADFDASYLPTALFVMPIIARLCMTMAIVCFPYARPEGMGKAFAEHANRSALMFAVFSTLLFVAPWGIFAIISMLATIAAAFCFAKYVTKILGGLTGDVYGAITHLGELFALFAFLCATYIMI